MRHATASFKAVELGKVYAVITDGRFFRERRSGRQSATISPEAAAKGTSLWFTLATSRGISRVSTWKGSTGTSGAGV